MLVSIFPAIQLTFYQLLPFPLSSLCTTLFYTLVLQASIIMDIQSLHSDIHTALSSDPSISVHLDNPVLCWSMDPEGLLHLDNCIYVPDMGNLWLRVLQHNHDHLLHSMQHRTRTPILILPFTRVCFRDPYFVSITFSILHSNFNP